MSFNNLGNFDDPELDQDDGFAPIPNGTYDFEVSSAKFETSSNGYVQLVLQCKIDGPKYAGRVVFERIITEFEGRANERQQKAVNIGKSKLKKLCQLNRLNRWPKDEREVVQWKFSATLDHREYNGKYYEEIKKFKPFGNAKGPDSTPSALYLEAKKAHQAEEGFDDEPMTEEYNDSDIPF